MIRILYIDDSALDQELVRVSLEDDGSDFELVTTGTREEFEKYLNEREFDLILTDFNILGFEGLDVIDMVQRTSPGIPVVIVTGTGSEEVAVQAMQRGVNDYVIKTTSHIRRLPQTLRAVLDKEELRRSAKQAEEQVFYHATLLASVSDAIIATDMENKIQYWNAAARVQYGWSAEEVIGRPLRDFIHIEYVKDPLDVIERKISEDGFWEGEITQNRRDGARIPILATISRINDLEGKCIGFLGINRDISERKQFEQALQDSEEKFRSLFNNNKAIMLLIDSETGDILESNPAASAYYGWSQEELARKKISEINALSPEEVRAEMRKAVREERNSFEFKHHLANGSTRDVEVFSSPIEHKGKTLLFSIIHDITERKQTEKELKENYSILVQTNEITVDRELLLYELKKEVNALLVQAGKAEKYPIHERNGS